MSSNREEGPVYYREIQKNAYLKRIPSEMGGNKLIPLVNKKPPLKPMWTLLCVHNGRTPYLEQYPDAESPLTMTHKPSWRACLRTARHVSASVKPHTGDEYDFLVDTDHGPVRMLAPDWDTMQDWVTTLRTKLQELKVLAGAENVYVAPPTAPPPRAPARDPTSPLPPVPPVPPDRVPGIELTSPNVRTPSTIPENVPENQLENETLENIQEEISIQATTEHSEIDISNWDTDIPSQPSTSQETKMETKSMAKICGQNICLDDSILKRDIDTTESDEEFFNEIDRLHASAEKIADGASEVVKVDYKQRVMVTELSEPGSLCSVPDASQSEGSGTNITVIQVSNKSPPHTAIPVLGQETDVFDFNFHEKLTMDSENNEKKDNFINIVNTEINVQNSNEETYGAVFTKESDYGHLSLTTTVNLTTQNVKVTDGVYERLCMASTSNDKSPLAVRKLKNKDKARKSSLPNLEAGTSESTYEYLFPNSNHGPNISLNNAQNGRHEINCNTRIIPLNSSNLDSNLRVVRLVERSVSQNTCDVSSSRDSRDNQVRRVQNNSPKRDVKTDKTEAPNKPIWKRGLTELSLISRLRGIGQSKRQESPSRQDSDNNDRRVTTPVKVVHRSRLECRVDGARRRSSSLNNGMSAIPRSVIPLEPLRHRQAACLRAEQQRGAIHRTISARNPPVFADYDGAVWIALCVSADDIRSGERVAAICGAALAHAAHAHALLAASRRHTVDILFHRVPLAKIYVLNKRDREHIGIKLDNECNIVSVDSHSPAGRAGLPPPGKWAVTEVNNRPLNLIKGGEEDMNRLSKHGTEVSILLQPSALIKKLRAAIKANKSLLGIR